MDAVTPIPLTMVTAGRELSEPRVSPDGATLAFLARWGSSVGVWAMPIGGGPERQLSGGEAPAFGRGAFGGKLAWHPAGDSLVYLSKAGSVVEVPASGGAGRVVVTFEERVVGGLAIAPDGTSVLIDVDQAEIWKIDLASGARQRLDVGDDDFVADAFVTPCGTTVLWTAWNVPDMAWDGAFVRTYDVASGEIGAFRGPAAVHQPGTFADGTGIGVRDDTGFLNVWIGDEPLVDEPFEHSVPTWGSGQRSYAVAPDDQRVAFWRNEHGYGTLNVVDRRTRQITEIDRGIFSHLDWSGDRLVAVRSGARTPPQIVSYATDDHYERRKLAFGSVAGWDAYHLPEPDLVEVDHDGVTLHARRYVAGEGKLLVMVHGGPTGQWPVEWNPKLSYWWSRGYDCYVVDPRGSTGFGREFQRSLNGSWGDIDVDDAAALIRCAHDQGWATPANTAIMGGSSGGLTVLGVMARHGDLVAGGVARYPVTDLADLAENSHRYEAHYTLTLVGPLDDLERYRRLSPITYAHEIERPLLVMHGTDDPVVPIAATERFVERARACGAEIDYVVMNGEGHGFREPTNVELDVDLTEAFLCRVMGP